MARRRPSSCGMKTWCMCDRIRGRIRISRVATARPRERALRQDGRKPAAGAAEHGPEPVQQGREGFDGVDPPEPVGMAVKIEKDDVGLAARSEAIAERQAHAPL